MIADPVDQALRSLYGQRRRRKRRRKNPAAPQQAPTVNVTVNVPSAPPGRPYRRVHHSRPGEGSTAQRVMRDIKPSPG